MASCSDLSRLIREHVEAETARIREAARLCRSRSTSNTTDALASAVNSKVKPILAKLGVDVVRTKFATGYHSDSHELAITVKLNTSHKVPNGVITELRNRRNADSDASARISKLEEQGRALRNELAFSKPLNDALRDKVKQFVSSQF